MNAPDQEPQRRFLTWLLWTVVVVSSLLLTNGVVRAGLSATGFSEEGPDVLAGDSYYDLGVIVAWAVLGSLVIVSLRALHRRGDMTWFWERRDRDDDRWGDDDAAA